MTRDHYTIAALVALSFALAAWALAGWPGFWVGFCEPLEMTR